jgi:predicted nucleotidyltransferase
VILFGSHARGDADAGSDLDFLVIERKVEHRLAEAVRLRSALRGFGAPVDVIVLDEALVQRRSKVVLAKSSCPAPMTSNSSRSKSKPWEHSSPPSLRVSIG